MIAEYLIATLVGGLLCLDRVAPQLMICRPIVAAPLLGALLGDCRTGLLVGSFLELLWIDRVPVGGYLPPDDTLAAVVITACTIILSRRLGFISHELISLTFIVFLPLAVIGQKMHVLIVKSNRRLADRASSAAEKPDLKMLERLHLLGLAKALVFPALLILVVTVAGVEVLDAAYRNLPPWSRAPLEISYFLLPPIGVAAALNMVKIKRVVPLFAALVLTSLVLLEYLFNLR